MTEYDTYSHENLVEMVEELTRQCVQLVGECGSLDEALTLKDEIIATQRSVIESHKAAAKNWQERALEACDELNHSRRETKYVRERRDIWLQKFLEERAECVRLAAELSPPF